MGLSWRRTRATIRRGMIQLLRDRSTMVMVLLFPVLELFLFAYAVDMTVDHIPMAVVDQARDSASRELVQALVASDVFDLAGSLDSEAQVLTAIDDGLVRAGLVIPPRLAEQIIAGEAQVLVIVDGSESFTASSAYAGAQAIAQQHGISLLMRQARARGMTDLRPPLETTTRVLYNPTQDEMMFVLPALAGLLLQIMAVNITAVAVVREKELGTMEGMLSTPVRPLELMLGRILPNMLLTLAELAVILVVGVGLFGVPVRGSLWLFVLLSVVFMVCGLGLGLLISTVSANQRQAQQLAMILMLFSFMLTGFVYPRAPMPALVRGVGNLIPLTYFARIARGIITKGIGLEFLWSDVAVLLGYALGAVALAAITFRKRLD